MNKGVLFLSFVMAIGVGVLLFPNGAVAAVLGAFLLIAVIGLLKLEVKDQDTLNFLTNIFLLSFLIRVLLATLIYGLGWEKYFGPDAYTYDAWGQGMADYWWGQGEFVNVAVNRVGWGMPYVIGAIYFVTGQNPLVVQFISCVMGAATTILGYLISKEIFGNNRAARYTAIFVGFFPAMIVWTSQLLKEGFIIFFLAVSLLAALNLQKKLSFSWVAFLLAALGGLFVLRSYVFLMVAVAIFGGFVLTSRVSAENLASRFVAFAVVGLAFAYMGVWNISSDNIQNMASLDRFQKSREWASKSAQSGVVGEGQENQEDVSTTGGALTALPLGLATLLFAPFPWQVGSLAQGLTMPEMVLWWGSLPFLITGLIYTIRNRFRQSVSILFFTLILSLTYALSQGNLGTIYRQRSQIQVFLLLFTAVGFALRAEKREYANSVLKAQRRMSRVPLR